METQTVKSIKRLGILLMLLVLPFTAFAEHLDIKWEVSDKDNIAANTITDGGDVFLRASASLGANMTATAVMTGSNADDGYSPVGYEPVFTQFTPATTVSTKTDGHYIAFKVTTKVGHTFKPTTISFDAAKCGTDKGNFDVYVKNGTNDEMPIATNVSPLRNKIGANNSTGYSHYEYEVSDILVQSSRTFTLFIYVYNFAGSNEANPKSLALRNVVIGGEADEPLFDASHYFTSVECSEGSLFDLVKNLKNGETVKYPEACDAEPANFVVTTAEGFTATVDYSNKTATISALKDGKVVFCCYVRFVISRGKAKPLNRGLMAVKVSNGVLVSWRWRKSDDPNSTRFRLYRNNVLIKNSVARDYTITTRTNWLDTSGNTAATYKLEVVDADGNVLETQDGVKAWGNQTLYITLQGGAPTDPTSAGATYTPNDASYCDMDGDGEYEIILKWAPSNEKDAASSGTTSPAFYSCYKMDGTRLWMLHTGHNMFNSAHTTPFVAWDLDGDGFGEFMVKTAPGAIDGEGKYVLLAGDDPKANLKGGKGKQDHGSEYITVFDGVTGAELKTIKYHTAFADENSDFWGDSNQNRSERYLAAIAWLDGEDSNPSAIFARGYYNGCKIGAYDWDGVNLTLRWLHRGESASKGTVTYANGTVKNLSTTVYGEGAHWISIGDVTGDGKQEIHYGSGALKPDGTTLYRTGLGHGDALHLSDFIPSRPGMEVFMAHEHKPYGADLRDAVTGEFILHPTASGDTGRGLIAHFNPEADDAYWQFSASAALYDTSGKVISESITHGGGASLNNRIFWNGDLADDYYDKSVLEYWNAEGNGFWRMQVNGGNYTIGNLNNYTKYNPCVLGDLLGDWREEIVTWDQSGNDYRLIINATDYQTDYRVPHLMDDYAYRAQVISQNDCYNQPPHLSYDLISEYTRKLTISKEGWDVFYTPYPVYVPEGITAYQVTGVNRATQVVNKTTLAKGATLPAGACVIVNGTPGKTVSFRPSTKEPVKVNATYLKGDLVTQTLTAASANVRFYQLQVVDENGTMAFKQVEAGTQQPAATPWLQMTVTTSEIDPICIDATMIPTGIEDNVRGSVNDEPAIIYDLCGRRIIDGKGVNSRSRGIYIQNGHKVVK